MDGVYSATLLLGFAAATLGIALRVRALARGSKVATGRAPGLVALAAGTVSLAVHASAGHGPASPEPMRAVEFAAEHPAYLVLLLLAAGALLPWPRPGRPRGGR